MDERRQNQRILISFTVECKALPHRSYFYTVGKDLSTAGIRIISSRFMSKGTVLAVNVNVVSFVIGIKARVVWCNKDRYSDRYLVGLEFLEVNQQGYQALHELVCNVADEKQHNKSIRS